MSIKKVWIKWLDHSSFSDQSWRDVTDIQKLEGGYEVETVGFLVDENEKQYFVVLALSSSGMFSGVMAILKDTVIDFQELKFAKR